MVCGMRKRRGVFGLLTAGLLTASAFLADEPEAQAFPAELSVTMMLTEAQAEVLGVGTGVKNPDAGGTGKGGWLFVPAAKRDAGTGQALLANSPVEFRCQQTNPAVTSISVTVEAFTPDGATNSAAGIRLGGSDVRAFPLQNLSGRPVNTGSTVAWKIGDRVGWAIGGPTGTVGQGVWVTYSCEVGAY